MANTLCDGHTERQMTESDPCVSDCLCRFQHTQKKKLDIYCSSLSPLEESSVFDSLYINKFCVWHHGLEWFRLKACDKSVKLWSEKCCSLRKRKTRKSETDDHISKSSWRTWYYVTLFGSSGSNHFGNWEKRQGGCLVTSMTGKIHIREWF